MSNVEQQYLDLVKDILENGHTKSDRTGTGTKSVFGRTIRHSMKDGFPLLTTKKVAFKTMVTELLWFLRGDTNIKYLVDNDCYIWVGDAYQSYIKKRKHVIRTEGDRSETAIQSLEKQLIYSKEEFINKIKTKDDFAEKWGELGPIYGKQWRSWNKHNWIGGDWNPKHDLGNFKVEQIDQIQNLINELKTNPDSRRLMVSAWNVGELDQMVLPPCHYSFQFYTRELSESELNILYNKRRGVGEIDTNYSIGTIIAKDPSIPRRTISLLWNQRSVDVGLGLPFNIASYALLLEIIAKQVNMIPEEVIGNLGDCHIYLNQIEGIEEQLTRTPYELPTVKISDRVVNDISEYTLEDFTLENYKYHPAIKLPLSN